MLVIPSVFFGLLLKLGIRPLLATAIAAPTLLIGVFAEVRISIIIFTVLSIVLLRVTFLAD